MRIDYLGGAYAVFAIVLAWDYLAPRIRMARVRRDLALRQRREAARKRP